MLNYSVINKRQTCYCQSHFNHYYYPLYLDKFGIAQQIDSTSPLLLSNRSRLIVNTIVNVRQELLCVRSPGTTGQISATLLPAVGNNKFTWRGYWGDRLLILRHGSGKQNPHSAAIALATPSPDPRRERREGTTTRPLYRKKKTLDRLAAPHSQSESPLFDLSKGSVRFTVCTVVTLRQVCSFQFSDNTVVNLSESIHVLKRVPTSRDREEPARHRHHEDQNETCSCQIGKR